MNQEMITALVGIIGVLIGSLISIWMTRHAVRFAETLRIVAILKDRLRICLTDIRGNNHGNCPSDIIMDCVKDTKATVTQLTSFAREATIQPIVTAWAVFAYGETAEYQDERDTNHEYFSAAGEVNKTRDKAIHRINTVLSMKI